ncbi:MULTISPECIES: type II toxin-antitoxin system RelE/ParE family toxin [unclassified Solwaraspora]|uniref:type II toxin-antitoxin system RelE/ParE family toxin n=1 Tax=unclassified Solwaraspora TaxID=2627926 RepID=UPI00338F0E2D
MTTGPARSDAGDRRSGDAASRHTPLSQFCYIGQASWPVYYHPEAEAELRELRAAERVAIGHAVDKLVAIGPNLGYPHSSDIKTATNLRELRPRAGRSRWRALYRQVGNAYVIGAIAPEVSVNQRAFRKAIAVAEKRIDEVRGDE